MVAPRYLLLSAFISCSTFSTLAIAAPNDVFLQVKPSNVSHPLSIEASFDISNDTVDIFNIRDTEKGLSDNAGDYQGGHLLIDYALHPQWAAQLGYWNRNIEYSQDDNKINSWLAAIQYKPVISPNLIQLKPSDEVAMRFSLWGNQADQLNKTSPTAVNGQRLSNIQVNDLSDIQAQVDLIFSRTLDRQNKLNGFASVGYSKVDVDSLTANLNQGNCNFNIQVESNNQLNGQLIAPCKNGSTQINEAIISYPASDYGLDINKDLSYDAGFFSVGGSWNWRYQKFSSQLGYQFQYLMRQDIDDRVSNYGSSAVKTNHTLGVDLAYQLNPYASVFVAGQAFKNNFIGTIPFLYNSVTASRLERKYGYASFGVRFANF